MSFNSLKIVIMRHAKVEIENRKIYANELKSVVEEYDQAPIEQDVPNREELFALVNESNYFLSSGLHRSVESLALLGKRADGIDGIFAEVESPYTTKKIMKLPIYIWGFWFKLVWSLGYSGGSRSYTESKEDALKASHILIDCAKKHGSVLLVGHGLKNMLIVKALKKEGWREEKRLSMKNWGYGIYEKNNNFYS
jgi:broad specificity phosphatase PhoE